MTNVYFHASWDETAAEFLQGLSKQTPGEEPVWNGIHGVTDPDIAEYHVAFNRYDKVLDPSRTLLFSAEPPVSNIYGNWDDSEYLETFPIEHHYKPQRWWLGKTYDELRALDPPEKTTNLSWITTDKGRAAGSLGRLSRRLCRRLGISEQWRRDLPLVNRGGTDGHVLRMSFLDDLVASNTDLLDLYGRGDFSGPYYKGEVENKWDGLVDYRYSLAIENYSGPNYFSEKLTDALLAWCMPIYWGCTNLEQYLPADSFVRIDIEAGEAVERVQDIVASNRRERNLDAIAEARRRLLEEYQIWPTIESAIETDRT